MSVIAPFAEVIREMDLGVIEKTPTAIWTVIPIRSVQLPMTPDPGAICRLDIDLEREGLITLTCEFEYVVPRVNYANTVRVLNALNSESYIGAWYLEADAGSLRYRMWHYVVGGVVAPWVAESFLGALFELDGAQDAVNAAYSGLE